MWLVAFDSWIVHAPPLVLVLIAVPLALVVYAPVVVAVRNALFPRPLRPETPSRGAPSDEE